MIDTINKIKSLSDEILEKEDDSCDECVFLDPDNSCHFGGKRKCNCNKFANIGYARALVKRENPELKKESDGGTPNK